MSTSAEALAAAPSVRRVPDFFIVGHPKSGTTALYEMLGGHPQIFMPTLKEPWFFASDMRPRFQPPRSAPTLQTLEDYLVLFNAAQPGQRVGEASSSYLLSRTAAGAIAQVCPDARIIAILREPASFLRSLHVQLLQHACREQKELQEGDRARGRQASRALHPSPLSQATAADVLRSRALRRAAAPLLRRVPPEQVLVLIYEDFRADNDATVRAVRRFLGVDEGFPVEVTDANPTIIRMRSQQLDELRTHDLGGERPDLTRREGWAEDDHAR